MVWNHLRGLPALGGKLRVREVLPTHFLTVFAILMTSTQLSAQESPHHHAFAQELAKELSDPTLAREYDKAIRCCRQGRCAQGHQVYRSIISGHPNDVIAIQCYLAILGCCVGHDDPSAADSIRKELLVASERVLREHPDADWTNSLCCLTACCAARIRDTDSATETKALEFADKALQCNGAACTDLSTRWQRADAYGLVYERRGNWAAAVDTYEGIIPELTPPQSWYFKVRLAKALEQQAASIGGAVCGSGEIDTPEMPHEKASQLRDRARNVLKSVISDADDSDAYGRLARQTLSDLENYEEDVP